MPVSLKACFRKATGEGRESVIAAIFWLKTRARWKETHAQEHVGSRKDEARQVHCDL